MSGLMGQDLSQLSNEDLIKAAGMSNGAQPSISSMSNEDLMRAAGMNPDKESGYDKFMEGAQNAVNYAGEKVGEGLNAVGLGKPAAYIGEKINRYSSAPSRAAIGALQGGEGLLGAAGAFSHQFGEDPSQAPSLQDLANRSGIQGTGNKILLKGALSLADPAVLIPADRAIAMGSDIAGPMAKAVAESPAGKYGLLAAKEGGDAIKNGLVNLPGKVGNGLLTAYGKAGEALTSVPEKTIKTYLTRLDSVNDLIDRYGKDFEGAADDIRGKYMASIQSTRQGLSNDISSALKAASPEQTMPLDPMNAVIEKYKTRINPKLNPEAIDELNDLQSRMASLAGPEGKVNVGDMFDIQQYMQDRAKGAYTKGGQIFNQANDTTRAARDIARQARLATNSASPEIAQANQKLSALHAVEDNLTKSLIKPGTPAAGLVRAGSQESSRQLTMLQKLQELTGHPMVEQAENLAAMRQFASPKWINPAATRSPVAAGIGYAIGHYPGMAAGAALTSPLSLKAATNIAGRGVNAVRRVGGLLK